MIIQSAMIGFLDAIIDGLTIQGARTEGIIDGAEKFQTFIICMQGVGAIAGGLAVSAVLRDVEIEPMQYMYIYVFFCGILLASALSLSDDAEPKKLDDDHQMLRNSADEDAVGLLDGGGYRSRVFIQLTLCEKCAHTFECIGTALKLEASYKPLLFFILRGCLIPNLDDTFYFVLIQEYEKTQEYYD